MLQNIRVLQIADLLIDEEEASTTPIINALSTAKNTLRPIHYLVVCGNITASGKPEQFSNASNALRKIRTALFGSNDPYARNRVFLVPGSTDAPALGNGARAYDAFAGFYNDFYNSGSRTISPYAPFDSSRAIVGSLVDLSLVGLCYFADVADPNVAIGNTLAALDAAKFQFTEWSYAIETATILVSSFPPLLSHDGSPRARQKKNNPELTLGLPISLHLVGGPVTCIEPEPYHCDHITIGVGPRTPSGRWSGRMNLIEIKQKQWGSGPEPKDIHRRTVAVTAHKWPDTVAGSKDPVQMFFGHEPPLDDNDGFVYQPIFSELADILDRGHVAIRVTGLPGKGKNYIFLQLQSQSGGSLFPTPRVVECRRMLDYKEWEEILNALIGKLAPRANDPPIMVIHDRAARASNWSPQYSKLQEIQENIVEVTRSGAYKVIYLLDYAGRPPELPLDFQPYELPPLNTEIMRALVTRYCSRLPISDQQINALTGGYLGFALSLLQEVKRAFDEEWSGARPIEADTSWRLLEGALTASDDLRRVTSRFFEVLVREAGGRELYDYLRVQLDTRIREHGISGNLVAPLTFTIEEVLQSLKDAGQNPEAADVSAAADSFVRARLLDCNDCVYRLRELIPFLVRALTAGPNATPASPDAGSTTRGQPLVFISYQRKELQRVMPIVDALRAEGIAVFWDQDILPGDKWNRKLQVKYAAASSVLMICTNSLESESYVWREVLEDQNKVIPVLIDEGIRNPFSFKDTQAALLTGWTGDRSNRQWRALIEALHQRQQADAA